eukprot:TRINITY_DN49520_c0_g1_i1.p1 TRINITY_DN49520_c0_g1~~TRINITY_DN49520_c0_g1_i1.p1  ORF type:complete len:823 (+),score=126.72 TRINITY_DN49520_c0_g1_i1:1202-3670(+)
MVCTTSRDAADIEGLHTVEPVNVVTGNGLTVANQGGSLPGFAGVMSKATVLPSSGESLNTVGGTCERLGCGYTVYPGNTHAEYWHPDHPGEEISCVKDGRVFRLPDLPDGCISLVVDGTTAETKVERMYCCVAVEPPVSAYGLFDGAPEWYRDHCRVGHPFDARCEHCLRARMKSRYHRRKKDKEFDKGGYTMSADFTGRRQPDIDGHTVALLACVHSFCDDPGTHGGEASYAFCALLVKRTAEATAKALDLFEAELQRIGKEKGRCVVRFHTDVDSSFLGAVERHAIRKGWRVTDTGGYNSQSNSVVERRIGLVKQTARAVLLTATGGVGYLQELWGHSMMFANDCVNRNDWGDREAPHTQLTGDSYQWGDHEHCFGEYVLWGVPKENRTNDLSEPGQQGLWMRADPTSSNAAVVVPIAWDADKDCWRLMPTVVATDYTVVKGVFPLRMCPPPGDDGSKFDSFIDAVYDPLMRWAVGSGQPPDEGEASDSGDSDVFYEVEKILNKKTVKGNNMYLIKWKGYGKRHNSWEPETNLNGELLQSFEAARDSHTALLVAAALEPGFFSDLHFEGVEDVLHDTLCRAYAASLHKQTEAVVHDSRKAVEHLMSKQKVGGTVDDWLPGYEAELEKVKRLRLRELEPEEAVRVRKDQLVPRLRMILEAKRDGRRKGRLILQGFLEPYSWDSGVSNDSPVVGMATIRCLLASMRVADVVSARDVSVAFLQSHGYNPDEPKRYVSYTAYKGAVEQVFQLLGPLYGQRSASRRWYETIVGWLTAPPSKGGAGFEQVSHCLLYTSDAADEEDSVDLGGRRIIKKKKKEIERVY